mmetsp:Transcript_13451/g.42000  ORF Transcript_13451/g.42000 Transcript_13451/m.42000 type:complete len:188 (-) Transcript_13451:104-667(-)
MTNVPLGTGGWVYQLGYRICVSGLGQGATKTAMQSAFGDFGHIIKIETPAGARGVAYISFQDKRDAQDAVKSMDGEAIQGHRVRVTLADDKPPPPRSQPHRESQVLTTTNWEREEIRAARTAQSIEEKARTVDTPARSCSRSPSRSRSRSRSRGRRRRRHGRRPSRSRGRRRSPSSASHRRGRGRRK